VLLGHDVVTNRESKARALTGGLGRKERLKQLVFDLGRNADAIVAHLDLDRIAEIPRRYLQRRLEFGVAVLPLALVGGIEAIADQVETDAGDVLGDKLDRSDRVGEISLQCDVEARILGAGTVIGEVQGILDQAVEIDAPTFAAAAP